MFGCSERETKQCSVVVDFFRFFQLATEDTLKRIKLLRHSGQQTPVGRPSEVQLQSRTFLQVLFLRIEHGHGVSAQEAGNISQVVDGVEAQTEPTNFTGLVLFCLCSQFSDIFEVLFSEQGIVVHKERRPLQGRHVFRNEVGPGVDVLSFIQQKGDFCGTSIICVLDQLFGHRKTIRV